MYKEIISPILGCLDSERMHVFARKMLHHAYKRSLTRRFIRFSTGHRTRLVDFRLMTTLASITLENPLLVGAGWDKEGEAVGGLYELGFAGVEVGTVLDFPQYGNLKPRQFMITPEVALNRLGFNNGGVDKIYWNLVKNSKPSRAVLGISVGKNKDVPDDNAPHAHAAVINQLYYPADYFAINVSSPNTPGLRRMQDKEPLTKIIRTVLMEMDIHFMNRKPIFVKIAPDLTLDAVDDVIEVVLENDLAGIIASNTTINKDIKAKYGLHWMSEAGGLSGNDEDFRRLSNTQIAHIWKAAGNKIDIVGVGGVTDIRTALEKIFLGARAVQIVTALRGRGPGIAEEIKRGLVDFMEKRGVKGIFELVGQKDKYFSKAA